MHLQAHPLTWRVLTRHYGAGPIQIDTSSLLLPYLKHSITLPKKVKLTVQIELAVPDALAAEIRPDSGYNLYRYHYGQLLDWITLHVTNGLPAYSSMMEYYKSISMDVMELDPDSVYRQWYRLHHKKKSSSHATIPQKDVIQKLHRAKDGHQVALRIVSDLIAGHPAIFYTRRGQPDPDMIKKVLIHTLYHRCLWRQRQIAELLSLDKSVVSRHLESIKPVISGLLT